MDYFATWGAILSTILAIIKWYQWKTDFDTSYNFTGEQNTYDVITLFNKSSRRVTICHYEFFTAKTKKDPDRKNLPTGNEGDYLLFSIAPRETANIRINEPYKFSIEPKHNLYMELNIMGQRKKTTITIIKNFPGLDSAARLYRLL